MGWQHSARRLRAPSEDHSIFPNCEFNFPFGPSIQLHAPNEPAPHHFSGDCDTAGNVQTQNAQPSNGCMLNCACSVP